MKLLRIKLPDSLHARLKVQAAMLRSNMQTIATEALERLAREQEQANARDLQLAKINPALASANPHKSGVDRRGL